jgi:hypothetical protein
MDWLNSSPLRLLVALATGVMIVLLTMILLPFLFVFWITYWLPHELDVLSRAAVPSPTEAETCDCDRAVIHDCVCPQCRDRFDAVQCQAGDVEKEEAERVFDYTAYLPEWWWN